MAVEKPVQREYKIRLPKLTAAAVPPVSTKKANCRVKKTPVTQPPDAPYRAQRKRFRKCRDPRDNNRKYPRPISLLPATQPEAGARDGRVRKSVVRSDSGWRAIR